MANKPTLRQGSKGPDVEVMQQLLNLLPNTLLDQLTEDGLFGRKTLTRVIEFQKNAKLFADGVVGPQSWAMLDTLTQALLPPGVTLATLGTWRNDPFREAVLKVALAEALPVSNVSDFVRLSPTKGVVDPAPIGKAPTKAPAVWRFGWPRLKQYFDEAVINVGPAYWRQTNDIKIDGTVETIMHLDGVRGNNWRVPNIADPNKGGIHWCGIFATWCWIQAGVPTKWPAGGPPKGITKRRASVELPLPKPGDMLVLGGNLVHHCLMMPDDAGPDHYLVVNGNSDFQSILIKPILRKSVVAIYSLEDFVGKANG
jgi:peptidoglycan hydrolase-like protein with peptidoglycan-binding domain